MMFDYSKLKGRIIEKYGSVEKFSKELCITPTTVGRKLSCKSYWTQDEIISACSLLDIAPKEVDDYFFCKIG